jgi:glycosyltransferase involved in cell wall biosynthesis
MLGGYGAYSQYEQNPTITKPIEEVYADLDSASREDDINDPNIQSVLFAYVLVPPVYYEGRWIKGLLHARAADYLAHHYPRLKEAFLLSATSFCCSFPYSKSADAYFCLYNNQHRVDWFKKANPERANKIFLPYHDADIFNEYLVAPQHIRQQKPNDIVIISRLEACKNLGILAEALKVYEIKFGRKLSCVLIVGTDCDINRAGLTEAEKEELRKMERVLVHLPDYMTIIPKLTDYSKIASSLASSKICLLGSLLEGKNRAIYEAMSCNTAVVCFEDFNKYARGEEPILPPHCGLTAPHFSGESMADTIHSVLTNYGDFSPRKNVLQVSGRKKTIAGCLSRIPHFRESIPDFEKSDIFGNLWYDLAIQENYQLGLHEFIFDKNPDLAMPRAGKVKEILEFYISRYEYFNGYTSGR